MKKVKVTAENYDKVIFIEDDYYTINVFDIPNLSLEELEKIVSWCCGSHTSPFEDLVWEIAGKVFDERVNKNGL